MIEIMLYMTDILDIMIKDWAISWVIGRGSRGSGSIRRGMRGIMKGTWGIM